MPKVLGAPRPPCSRLGSVKTGGGGRNVNKKLVQTKKKRGTKGEKRISKNKGACLVKGTQMAYGHLSLKHRKTQEAFFEMKTLQTMTPVNTV